MKFFHYDKTLSIMKTPQGTMTLSRIFVPFFTEMLLLNMMGTINTLMLSHYSDDAVAAVGSATQLLGMILTFYTVISTGASIVINHNLGAENTEKASDAALTSIILCGSLSLILGTCLSLAARPLLGLMHLQGQVLDYAVTYFRIAVQFSFFQAVTSSISGIFRSYGKPKISVCVSLTMNGMNAALAYLVIFRPIDLPVSGVSGIAAAYVCSQLFGLLLILTFLRKIPLGLHFRQKNFASLKVAVTMLKVGIPGGISSISYNLSQVVSTSIIAILGVAAISTKIYVSNIVFYVYVFGMSLGLSTSLMIGWLAGAGKYEQAYRLNLQNLKLTISANVMLSFLIFLLAEPLLGCFTTDPQIISMGRHLMLIDILVEIGRGFNHVEENSLRGAGDVVYPMAVSMISCWTMSILFSYILGIRMGLGLTGCWIAFAMDEFFRGTAYLIRWRSRKWTTKTVAVHV